MRAKPPETLDLAVVGECIRELRGNMRQQELAKRMRISRGQLAKVERGRLALRRRHLSGFRREFGKPVDWFVRGGKA